MTKFRIQYLSNLFLSHKNPTTFSSIINPVAPYLALLGNIGYSNCEITRNFLKDAEKNYEKIFWIPGALEYSCAPNTDPVMWQIKSDEYKISMKEWGLEKTTFCQKSKFVMPTWPFTIFATPAWHMTMSRLYNLKIYNYDSKYSVHKPMTDLDFVHLYYNELGWIQRSAKVTEEPIILLTYSPIDPIILRSENIPYHLYGVEIDNSYNVKTGGYSPWIGINSFGHKHFSKNTFMEHEIVKTKYL
jgi:hypothetical protein